MYSEMIPNVFVVATLVLQYGLYFLDEKGLVPHLPINLAV